MIGPVAWPSALGVTGVPRVVQNASLPSNSWMEPFASSTNTRVAPRAGRPTRPPGRFVISTADQAFATRRVRKFCDPVPTIATLPSADRATRIQVPAIPGIVAWPSADAVGASVENSAPFLSSRPNRSSSVGDSSSKVALVVAMPPTETGISQAIGASGGASIASAASTGAASRST